MEILAAAIAMLAATAVVVAVAVDTAAVVVGMAVNARVAVAVVVVAATGHVVQAVPAALLAGKTGPTNTRRLCPD